jgi:hypothetical protein
VDPPIPGIPFGEVTQEIRRVEVLQGGVVLGGRKGGLLQGTSTASREQQEGEGKEEHPPPWSNAHAGSNPSCGADSKLNLSPPFRSRNMSCA